jgi:hypothetical protein
MPRDEAAGAPSEAGIEGNGEVPPATPAAEEL